MKDLIAIDPETNERVNYGLIADKRVVGGVMVWLTYDESSRMWWIVLQDERLRKLGFVEERRETCWELFYGLDETTLAAFRSS